jgi:hypothetical protein
MKLGPRPAGRPWTPAEDAQLLAMTDSKMDRASIARKLKRTVPAISKRRSILNNRRLSRSGAQMNPHHSNDDKSPLIDLFVCIVCRETMKIQTSTPDAEGTDIVQYRCGRCGRIERVRLFRRSRDAPA